MSAADLALQSMKKRGGAVAADNGAAAAAAAATTTTAAAAAAAAEAKTHAGGEKDPAAVAVAQQAGEPMAAQLAAYTGKDFEKLYGHPDRWACLDSSDVYEDEHVLVMKTHALVSKCVAVTVWVMSLACIGSAPWAAYIYVNADNDPVSPRYYQSKLCAAVSAVNLNLQESDKSNATLLLECDPTAAMVIPVIGDLFWVIWTVLVVAMVFAGCCAPPDRVIVLEKDDDTG
jgi:hypothetical protein